MRRRVNVGDPGVREQAQVKLFGKLPRRLAGEVVGALTLLMTWLKSGLLYSSMLSTAISVSGTFASCLRIFFTS